MGPHLTPAGIRRKLGRPAPLLRVQLQRQLAQLDVFSGCDRRQLARLARWGDLVHAAPGEVLLREDRADWWFMVVLTGSLVLSRGGCPTGAAVPGDHLGEDTVVGLRPQPATVTTSEPAVLFMLGPRYLLSLLSTAPSFQRTLFPDVDPRAYPEFSRRMLEQGRAEWQQVGLPPGWSRPPVPAGDSAAAAWPVPGRRPGRAISMREAVSVITRTAGDPHGPPAAAAARARSPWWGRGVAAGAAVVVASTLLAYHPPLAVVTVGQPIDVLGDITVAGVPVHHPHGRYLLLWIHVSRPDLAGTLAAFVTGRTTVSTGPDPPADQEAAAERQARLQYLDSQSTAVASALRTAGLDPRRVHVRIRDRGLSGPSAGLVYALAVTDLLGRDLLAGRSVAATGSLGPDGRVGAVGWVAVKAQGAADAGATVLLVPQGEDTDLSPYRGAVYPVSSLAQALAVLSGSRP